MSERLDSLERLLEADPENSQLLRECAALAQRLIASGDYPGAAETLERLSRKKPAEAAIQQDLGLCYFCLREYARARPHLESVYGAGERSSGLLRLLVSTDHRLGLLAEAAAVADANAAPARTDAALAGTYALLYLDYDRPTEAAQWAQAALALDPKCVDALTVEGTLSIGRGDTDRASACFESVLGAAPQTGRAVIGLGSIDLLRQDFPRALVHLQRGVELMPEHVGSWHMLAWTYLLAGDLGSAEQTFEKALALNRNFAETHGGLAAVAALRGDTPAAQRGLETALRLDPACLSAQFARSVLAGRGGDAKMARKILLTAFSGLVADPAKGFAKTLTALPPGRG